MGDGAVIRLAAGDLSNRWPTAIDGASAVAIDGTSVFVAEYFGGLSKWELTPLP
jgi:hypothetical protein